MTYLEVGDFVRISENSEYYEEQHKKMGVGRITIVRPGTTFCYEVSAVKSIYCNSYTSQDLILVTQGEEKNMSVTPKEVRDLKLTDDERALREAGFVDETGKLTEAGREVVLDKVFADKRDEIVTDLKALKKAKETK